MENTKIDITMQSDQELCFIVFNDETLYKMRRNTTALIHRLNETYIFTEAQLDELKEDLRQELEEMKNDLEISRSVYAEDLEEV